MHVCVVPGSVQAGEVKEYVRNYISSREYVVAFHSRTADYFWYCFRTRSEFDSLNVGGEFNDCETLYNP